MKTKLLSAIFAIISLSGCSCKSSYMPENFIVKPEDKNMNCQQIIYAINETEFWMKNVNERCVQPHVFAKFAPCTPMVKLDAMRNEYTLSDRAQYLRSLYKLKGCEASLKLKGGSIERQASKIGGIKVAAQGKPNESITNKMQLSSTGQIITDIPVNTQ